MAIATKKLLADGLKELLEKKTLDKITVKELVATCGVNRQTFYYNFQDIYELLEWIFVEEGKRVRKETAEKLKEIYDNVEYDELSRVLMIKNHEIKNIGKGTIAILAAGTSDIAVADEAYYTAKFLGNNVERIYDVGVAGIHRLLNKRHLIEQARVVVAVAGMEGALPSVVGGMVDVPVIAVPTSVGYGASFNGLTALLAMLNSCASGISVVNIDNGFWAGYFAASINKLK